MTEEVKTKGWLQTMPGFLVASACVLAASAALVIALSGLRQPFSPNPKGACISGGVWRGDVYRDDHVCVIFLQQIS
jgi:hypothetical protein